jgi:hypothetical protein
MTIIGIQAAGIAAAFTQSMLVIRGFSWIK